jgi:hypothetical protein
MGAIRNKEKNHGIEETGQETQKGKENAADEDPLRAEGRLVGLAFRGLTTCMWLALSLSLPLTLVTCIVNNRALPRNARSGGSAASGCQRANRCSLADGRGTHFSRSDKVMRRRPASSASH